MASNQHLYFLVHSSHERFKVGLSARPLSRWSQIQPHAQTDFAASLVFDVSADVRAKWVEETVHRALSESRYAMPSCLDGFTEWFDYSALETALAFAREYRELLGISEGYAIPVPQVSNATPLEGRDRALGPAAESGLLDSDTRHNEGVAGVVEAWVEKLVDSDAVLGTATGKTGVNLYLRRGCIPLDEIWSHRDNHLFSGRRAICIFGSALANDTFVRLSISAPFYDSRNQNGLPSTAETLHPSELWVLTAPGFERVRAAVRRLVARVRPLPVEHSAAALSGSLLVGA
jgi:hypothetical protein